MAIKQLSHLDFQGHQIQNASIHPLAAAPTAPKPGQAYFDTTLKCLRIWNATDDVWQDYTFSEQLLIKKSFDIGDAVNLNYTITHNMGTQDLIVLCYDKISKDVVDIKYVFDDVNNLTVMFGGVIPAINEYRVVIIGGYGATGAGGGSGSGGTGSGSSDLIQQLGTLSSNTAITFAGGKYVKATLAANLILTLANGTSNTVTEKVTLELTQDSPGSRLAGWGVNCKFPSGIAPTLSTDAGSVDLLEFTWNGTVWHLTNFVADSR